MEKYRGPCTIMLLEQWNDIVKPFRKVEWVKEEKPNVKILYGRAAKWKANTTTEK